MSAPRGVNAARVAFLYSLLCAQTTAQTSPSSPACTSYLYTVPALGTFTNFANYTFGNLDNTLPAGLTASDDTTVGDLPYSQVYEASNVVVRDGFMQLMVPGGQTAAPYSSAQVMTEETDIMYASVRTTAILASPAGTVNGMFFYHSDSQESDIEYVTNASASANTALAPYSHATIPVQFTNQPNATGVAETHTGAPSSVNATSIAHEYRWDWVPGSTAFYVDGMLQSNFTTNVPTTAGRYMFNNWANGNPGFSTGPPVQDSIFYVSNVVMYYNTTASSNWNGTCDGM